MKKIGSVFIASVLAVLICTGCSGGGNESGGTVADYAAASVSEASVSETEAETETQTESETKTETQTKTETEPQTEEITSSAAAEDGYAEYGNDITGYIYLPAGWDYSENEAGEFTAVSPDGLSLAESLLFTGFAGGSESERNITVPVNGGNITVSAIEHTALKFCETAVLNSEMEGYNVYDTFEMQCGDIRGFRAEMLDTDTYGFRYYAAFPDEENGNIYAVKIESSDYTVKSILGAAVYGYHRVSDMKNR